MIVMVNGSFGVGKTSVAKQISEKIPDFMIFDPELVGSMLNEATIGVRAPDEDTEDFQDLRLWPKLVVEVARQLREHYDRSLVVPMTIDNIERLNAIRKGFESFDDNVRHFCLIAPLDVIEQRLRDRKCDNGDWVLRRARECVSAFVGPTFETYIDTKAVDVKETAELIIGSLTR